MQERTERGVVFQLSPLERSLRRVWLWLLGGVVLISIVFAISGVSWGNVLLLGLLFAAYFLFLVWVASWGNVIELKSRKIRLADTSSPIQYVAYEDVRRITRHSGAGIELEYVASNKSVQKVELQPENVSDLVDELSRRYETATGRPLEMVG